MKETKVPRSRYPLIDFHTHITVRGPHDGRRQNHLHRAARRIAAHHGPQEHPHHGEPDRRLWRRSARSHRVLQTPHPDRFVVFTEPTWSKAASTRTMRKFQADQIEDAHRAGARGLKVLKTLGLYLREQVTTASWSSRRPALRSDVGSRWAPARCPWRSTPPIPMAFFLPIDRFNERWEELHNHPDWSFYGKDFPCRSRTAGSPPPCDAPASAHQFRLPARGGIAKIWRMFPNAWTAIPNMYVDIAARIGELGRQPRTSRKFFDKYQDRIVFGTDAIPKATNFPQQVFEESLYEIYYRFLETEDEYFDYAPAKVPPQGRWRIYGLGLTGPVLHKVYWQNAARLLSL